MLALVTLLAGLTTLTCLAILPAPAAALSTRHPGFGTHSSSAADDLWDWPVDGARDVLRRYDAPATRYSAGHRGIDIRAPGNVYAPEDGVVSFVGYVVDRPVLSIQHNRGLVSSFEPVESSLAVGDSVRRGQRVGTVATSTVSSPEGAGDPTGTSESVVGGHCGSACVHFGVRRDGEYLSPLALFGQIPPAVLLPTRDDAL